MASSAQIDPLSPETLPADFSEWDGNSESPAPSTVTTPAPAPAPAPPASVTPISNGRNFEVPAAPVAIPRPASHQNKTQINVLPPVNRLRTTAPVAAAHQDAEALFQPRRSSGVNVGTLRLTLEEPVAASKSKYKNKMMVAVVSVCSILLLFILIQVIDPNLLSRLTQKESVVAQPVQPAETQAATPYSQTSIPDAEPATSAATTTKPSAAATPLATTTTAPKPVAAAAPLVEAGMMNSQLSTPVRIPREMKAAPVQDAPPPSGVSGIENLAGNGNGIGNLFKGQAGPKVKAEKVNISAGVAVGLLIQKTAPVYPPIAKSARVAGTVVLGANISKNGSIIGLHVVSGPPMLQQSAMDAVRSWRYRPYMLNNQPVEVETTVSVIFTLDH
jgi:protein TonB